MNSGDIKVGIVGNDEFGNGDTRSTPLAITTHEELKSSVEIGANTTRKGQSLMLSTTSIIVLDDWIKSLHNLDNSKNNDLATGWSITTITFDLVIK